MVLVIGVALVVTLVALIRHDGLSRQWRTLGIIVGVAALARIAAVIVVYAIASPIHGTGVWLSDEASYFLATESLMPWAWDRALPEGLGHLGGNGYLGLTTALSEVTGVVDAQALRVANATLGTLVVLMCALIGNLVVGRAAGFAAALVAALWPDLILWSATMLRDTLCSFGVVGIWWALVSYGRERWRQAACVAFLGIVLLATLRTYLAVSAAVGVAAWLVFPLVQRYRRRTALASLATVLVSIVVVGLTQQVRIDAITHELLYRQTVTRMETLGRLYRDPPPADEPIQMPYRQGTAIALVDPQSGWLTPGLVIDSATPGQVDVGLIDDTSRAVPIDDNLVLLQDTRIPPLQLFRWLVPSLLAVFAGLPTTEDAPSVTWIATAVAWDALLIAALVGIVRGSLSARAWLYPLCVVGGTVAALAAIPGSPGNAERHRANQTVPLLVVLASGIVASRAVDARQAGRPVVSATSMPTSATTAMASSRRSAR